MVPWNQTYDLLCKYIDEHQKLPPQTKNSFYCGTNLGGGLTLCKYIDEHQKLPPQTKNGFYCGTNLGVWINTQRKAKKGTNTYAKMTPDREKALEAIPEWSWEYDADEAWNQTYALLCEYVDKYKKLPPLSRNGIYHGTCLGTWINTQRIAKKGRNRTKMKPDRVKALEDIPGWSWGNASNYNNKGWNWTYALLCEYVREHQKLPPRGKKGVYRGKKLGKWVHNQRQAKKGTGRHKMTPCRVKALEKIPEWRW